MFTKKIIRNTVPLLALLLAPHSSAYAQETPTFSVQVGKDKVIELTSPTTLINTYVQPSRSYCCEVVGEETNEQSSFSMEALVSQTLSVSTSNFGELFGLNNPVTTSFSRIGERVCFLTNDEATQYIQAPIYIDRFVPGGDVNEKVSFGCEQTSLFGGFNTFSSEVNFLEVSILDSSPQIGFNEIYLTIEDSVNNKKHYINRTIPENFGGLNTFRLDINIHEIVGPNAYGTVTVNSLYRKGAVKATMAYYDITSTDPLKLTPVRTEKFENR